MGVGIINVRFISWFLGFVIFPILLSYQQTLHSSENSQTKEIPIVFVHGIGVNGLVYEAIKIESLFKHFKRKAYVAEFPALCLFHDCATVLEKWIKKNVKEPRFHLVGHSMGGIVSRYLISNSDLYKRVVSLTTLATPHYGSEVADYVIEQIDRYGKRPSEVPMLSWFGNVVELARQLTSDNIKNVFNQKVRDREEVKYFSFSFYIPTPIYQYALVPYIWIGHNIINNRGYPMNDGLVSLESSVWGEHVETIEADHLSQTAPIPFGGRFIYDDIFKKVNDNLITFEK